MSNRASTAALVAALLLSPAVVAQDFEEWTLGLNGCASVDDDGRLVLLNCYAPESGCSYAEAVLVASVPGTFTVDLDWDVTGEKEYMTLFVTTASGSNVFSVLAPFGFDAWCLPAPCGEHVEGIAIRVDPGDEVRFELSANGEPCLPGPDGTRCVFQNIVFVPDPGVYDLGHAHGSAPIYEVAPDALPDTGWVGSLDLVGDLDGDGVTEFVVGTPAGFEAIPGRVTVFSGVDGAELFAIDGIPEGKLGWAVSGVDDIDGDGTPDFAASEPEFPGSFHPPGRVLVWSGSTGELLLELHGNSMYSDFGESLDGIGDVNGDGRGDLAVGVPGSEQNGVGAGAVEVYSGATGEALYTFLGDEAFDYFGTTVAGVGDVDDDGVPDIAGGSLQSDYGENAGGLVRVWSGATGDVLYEFTGFQGDQFARVIVGAGDVDGDGHADIAIGNAHADNRLEISNAGRVEVRSGATGEVLYSRGGVEPGQSFGTDVAAVGDVDGDGFADLAIGDFKWQGRGRAVVYGGPDGRVLVEVSSDNHTGLARLLAGGEDLDLDGRADLLAVGEGVTQEAVLIAMSGSPTAQVAPALHATGSLLPGMPLSLLVSDGPPLATAALVLGFSTTDEAILGGFLVPSPDQIVTGFALDARGAGTLTTVWPAALVAPLSVIAQVWIPQPQAASGVVATNAVALNP